MPIIKCKNPKCRKEFWAHNYNRKYCSTECRKAVNNESTVINKREHRAKERVEKERNKLGTINKTLKLCKELNITYAEHQLKDTLSRVPKINTELF